MSDRAAVLYPFPEELSRLPRDRSAAIEASAGTGKTFLIEHMVVDRLVRGDARLDEMLVVTFTERAAAELRRRIQGLIQRVRLARAPLASTQNLQAWTIDDAARDRLAAAARAIDGAPISTIHAFCQRVLTERAFAGGRLLIQQAVESRTAFTAAFAEVLRQELAVHPAERQFLEAYLASGGSVSALEELLYRAHQVGARWATTFDPVALAVAARPFVHLEPAAIETALAGLHWQTTKAARERLLWLCEAARLFDADQRPARFLVAVDCMVRE